MVDAPNDGHPLDDERIDQTLSELFADAQAAVSASPALVRSVVAQAQSQERRRARVLLGAGCVGALLSLAFLLPALDAVQPLAELLPRYDSAAQSWPALPLLAAAVPGWFGWGAMEPELG